MMFPPSLDRACWRLIRTPPASGSWNMAVDDAILESMGHGGDRPVLRLYSWEPPCLSLGYAQPYHDVKEDALDEFGWEVVRRPTGGRAILHTDELTYSVIGPSTEPRLAGSLLESYQRLSAALLAGLQRLGIAAQTLEPAGGTLSENSANPVCFEIPSSYEITSRGKKLIGSAQARRKDGILQHGSLPLSGDLTRILQVLNFSSDQERDDAAWRLLARAATAEEALGHAPDWNAAAEALVYGFQAALNLEFVTEELRSVEISRATELVTTKYTHPSWNRRV